METSTTQTGTVKIKDSFFHSIVKENIHAVLTVVGIAVAVIIAVILRTFTDPNIWDERTIMYIKFIGVQYLNMFQGLVIPLVTAAVVASVGSMDINLAKELGGLGTGVFLIYTFIAGMLGTLWAVMLTPGNGVPYQLFHDNSSGAQDIAESLFQDKFLDLFRSLFPPNMVQACLETYVTKLGCPEIAQPCLQNQDPSTCCFKGSWTETPNLIGLTVFSVALGVALAKAGVYGRPVLAFFQSLAEAITVVTHWIMWLTPISAFALSLGDILQNSNAEIIKALVKYVGTVIPPLAILTLSYPILFYVITKQAPFSLIGGIFPALFTAFTTSSSLITVPIMLRCLDECDVNKRVSRILIPLGSRINLNGTAVFQAVSTIFIAQIHAKHVQRPISVGEYMSISVGSSSASMATIGIPGGGVTTLQQLLGSIGISPADVEFIVPVDLFVDSLRTSVNVFGCAVITAAISHIYNEDLKRLPSYDLDKENAVLARLTLMENLNEADSAEELMDPSVAERVQAIAGPENKTKKRDTLLSRKKLFITKKGKKTSVNKSIKSKWSQRRKINVSENVQSGPVVEIKSDNVSKSSKNIKRRDKAPAPAQTETETPSRV